MELTTRPKRSIRVLLIEPDPTHRSACRLALENCGDTYSLSEAETAADGLRLARSQKVDCLLVAQDLPDFTGLELLAELTENGNSLPAPAIILARPEDAAAATRGLQLGAADFIVKNDSQDSLEWAGAVISRALREHELRHELAEARRLRDESQAKYRALVEQLPGVHYIASLDQPGKLLCVGEQIRQFGYRPEECLETPEGVLQWVHPDDRERVIDELSHTYEHHLPFRCEYRVVCADGRSRWVRDEARLVGDGAGQAYFLQGLLSDISEVKDMAEELAYFRGRLNEISDSRTAELRRQLDLLASANRAMDEELSRLKRTETSRAHAESRARLMLESAGDGFLGVDRSGRCTFANETAARFLGSELREVEGQDLLAILRDLGVDDALQLHRTLKSGVPCRFTETVQREDAGSISAEFAGFPIKRGGEVLGAVLIIRDVSETEALTAKLSYEASHDALTGLMNRLEFERRVARALQSAQETGNEHALCFIDLDRFKLVNDTHGHAAGDFLLRSLGVLLDSRLRQSDVLARLGGDEFGLLLENCPPEQAWLIANELRDTARNFRCHWKGQELSVGMSIGVAALNGDSGDASSVLAAADAACYTAKKRGSNRLCLANPEGLGEFVAPKAAGQQAESILPPGRVIPKLVASHPPRALMRVS